jgi:hypothetical protein
MQSPDITNDAVEIMQSPDITKDAVEIMQSPDITKESVEILESPNKTVRIERLESIPETYETTHNFVTNRLHTLESPVDPELLDNILVALQLYPDCKAKDDCFQFLRSNHIIPLSHILLIQFILNDGVILKECNDPDEYSDTQNSHTQHNALLSSIVLK